MPTYYMEEFQKIIRKKSFSWQAIPTFSYREHRKHDTWRGEDVQK